MALHRLLFDAANPAESANVGAYLRDANGDLLTSTLVGGDQALDVNIVQTVALTVSATDLDIRDLAFATDSVDVSGSAVSITGSVAVTATDLDIRDLAFATDSVDVSGSEVSLDAATLAALENITVSATDLDIRNLVFADDKVDVSGSSVSISGTVTTQDIYNTAVSSASESISTSGALVTSVLSNREMLWVYNNGTKAVFLGASGVTTGNGFPIYPGAILEGKFGAAVALHAVAQSGTQDVRILQAS
jgi:hypothetical protein